MVNEELVKQLLRELESEKGCPVQIRVDTPESVRYADEETSEFMEEMKKNFEDESKK